LGTEWGMDIGYSPRQATLPDNAPSATTLQRVRHVAAVFLGVLDRWPLGEFLVLPGDIAVSPEYLASGIFKIYRRFL